MTRRQKRYRSLLIGCAVFVLMLSVGLTAATAKPHATVTLRFVTTNTVKPAFDVLIANFNRVYPDIHVDATYLASDQFNAQIPVQLAAGNGPDLFTGFPGTGALPSIKLMAQAGYLADLSTSKWAKRVPDTARPDITIGKALYAWPLGQSAYFILYNKTAFADLGLKPTKTFSGLARLCTKIKAAGKIPFVQAGAVGPNNGIAVLTLAAGTVLASNPNWNAQRASGKVTFAGTTGWHQAVQEIKDLSDGGCFEPAAQGVTVPSATAMFATGKALMWIANSQNIGLVRAANPDLKFGVFAPPAPTAKSQIVMVAYPTNIVVNAKSSNLADAKTFVDFLARAKQSSLWAKVAGYTAPFDATQGVLSSDLQALVPYFKSKQTRPSPLFSWPNPTIFAALSTNAQGLFTGQKSVDDVVASMDAAYNTK
jgi:raffinose/stachyose/melibiose transport system substrate-binding protein